MTVAGIKKPSYLKAEPFADYQKRRSEYLTNSLLKQFRKSPRLAQGILSGEYSWSESTALNFGSAFHTYTLENQLFKDEFAVENKEVDRRKKDYKDWRESQGTKVIIAHGDYEVIQAMNKSISEHPIASVALSEGWSENTIITEISGVKIQVRIDHLNPNYGICDLKTCQDLDKFQYDIRKYEYIYQGALYSMAYEQVSQEFLAPEFFIIACEKNTPYRVGVFTFKGDDMEMAKRINKESIREFGKCKKTKHWPLGDEWNHINIVEL